MESEVKDAEKSKAKVSKWVVGLVLLFVVGMFVVSATPFGLAVWLGTQDEGQQMVVRIQQAPLHREAGALARLFRVPVVPQEVHWREVSMRRPLWGKAREDKALWAVLHYDEAGFEALRAQLPAGESVDLKVFLHWLVEDLEKNMRLRLGPEEEVLKLPSALFASEAAPPKSVSAYWVPAQRSLLLMRLGAAEFVAK